MKRTFWTVHGPVIGWAMLIFIASSIPSLQAPDLGFSPQDKVAHVIEYGIFGILLQRSLISIYGKKKRAYILCFLLGVGYGITDEVHQLFVEGREASIYDVIADSLGVLLGQLIYYFKHRH